MELKRKRRIDSRAELRAEITKESETNFYAGATNNISDGGVFVATWSPPPLGTLVDLTLVFPASGDQFACIGVVRWLCERDSTQKAEPTGCGIEWISIPVEAHRAIRAFARGREAILFGVA